MFRSSLPHRPFHLSYSQESNGPLNCYAPVYSNFANSASYAPQAIDVRPCRSSADQDAPPVEEVIQDLNPPVSLPLHEEPVKLVPDGVAIELGSASQDDSLVNVKPANLFLQAGGHKDALTLYKNDPNKIIKKTKNSEAKFYHTLAPELDTTLEGSWDGWRPKYYGWEKLPGGKNDQEAAYVILENITSMTSSTEHDAHSDHFWHPTALDIKLGKNLVSETANPAKKARKDAVSRKTTSGTVAMRLAGAAIWDNQNRAYVRVHKKEGQAVKTGGSDLEEKFNAMFPIFDGKGKNLGESTLTYSSGGLSPVMMKVILNSLIPQVKKIFEHVSKLKWSSPATSVLLVYEGDAQRLEKVMQSNTQIPAKISDARLIDFAYARGDTTKVDEGLVLGLKSTLDHLNRLLGNIEKLLNTED